MRNRCLQILITQLTNYYSNKSKSFSWAVTIISFFSIKTENVLGDKNYYANLLFLWTCKDIESESLLYQVYHANINCNVILWWNIHVLILCVSTGKY